MFFDMIEIFKARKNPALAAKLGARFASGAAIERLGWPLVIAKFWMAIGIAICVSLIGALAFSAFQWGSGFLIPVILPALIMYALIRIWRGLNKGVERVKRAAQNVTDAGIDRMGLHNPAEDIPST